MPPPGEDDRALTTVDSLPLYLTVGAKLLYVGASSSDSYRKINKKSKIGTIFWLCKTMFYFMPALESQGF